MVKTKKEIELEKENKRLNNKNGEYLDRIYGAWEIENKIFAILMTIIFTLGVFSLILCFCGVFNDPIKKLGIDKNDLAKDYVVGYYPEYENCSIVYDNSICRDNAKCYEGAEVYCRLNDRDGLSIGDNSNPTETIYFTDITLKKIFANKINLVIN